MHKQLPNFFIFVDHYKDLVFKKNTNIGLIYRNYKDTNRENNLIKIAKECKKNRYQLFISNDIKLTHKFKADGIYIPSFSKTKKFANLERKNLTILGSAHNYKEIHNKIMQNCNAIFLSPIFNIKKTHNFLDILKFNNLAYSYNVKFFALGGISHKNVHKLKLLRIKGFGGITMFKKKPAYKRPVFLKNNFF